ncbi:MAG: hypothetical protein K0Q94_3662 [Paenibacillus sp.]|uniref:hypothetical protein n=1 Tax=Paenibacillus sp. GCM10012303 TaxID=3317340 RepID=UPI0029EFC32D|nr:hypothetical protein [Paenibacillus sp.]
MHRLDKEATVYNYKLVKRIRHRPLPLLLYGVLPLSAALYLAVAVSAWSLLWMAGGIVLIPLMLCGLTSLYLKYLGSGQRGSWSFDVRPPWFGLIPGEYAPLGGFIRIHRQLFWIGLAVLGCLYPWVPLPYWLSLLATHIWYMLPQMWIIFLLKRAGKPGLLKITRNDTSFYME